MVKHKLFLLQIEVVKFIFHAYTVSADGMSAAATMTTWKEVSFFNDFIMFLEVNYFEMNCVADLSEMLDILYEDTIAYDNY